jgi:hypothetical protein
MSDDWGVNKLALSIGILCIAVYMNMSDGRGVYSEKVGAFDRFVDEWGVSKLVLHAGMIGCLIYMRAFPETSGSLVSVVAILYVGQIVSAIHFSAKMFGHGLGRIPSLDRAIADIQACRPAVRLYYHVPREIPIRKELAYASWEDRTVYRVRASGRRPLCLLELDVIAEFADNETTDAFAAMRASIGRIGCMRKDGLAHVGGYVVASTGAGRVPRLFHPLVFWALALLTLDWPYRVWLRTIADSIPLRVSKRVSVGASLANAPTGSVSIEMGEMREKAL